MPKDSSNGSNTGKGRTIKAIQAYVDDAAESESSKALFKKIASLPRKLKTRDNPMATIKKAAKLVRMQISHLILIQTRGDALHAFLAIVIGKNLNTLKEAFNSLPKEDRNGLNWGDFLRKHSGNWSIRSCQERMQLAEIDSVHPFAVFGYTTMRHIQRIHKRMGEVGFTEFIERQGLAPEENQDVTPDQWKERLEEALKKEGVNKGAKDADPSDDGSTKKNGPEDKSDGTGKSKANQPTIRKMAGDLRSELSKLKQVRKLEPKTRTSLKKLYKRIEKLLKT